MGYRSADSAPIGLHYSGPRGVAPAFVVGASSAATPANHLGISLDGGLTWAAATVPAPGGIGWFGIAYKPGYGAVASSANSGAASAVFSLDGLTWTALAANNKTAGNWRRMVYSSVSDLFVQVGIGGVAGQRAHTSPDGITWTLRPTPNVGGATSSAWSEIIECASGRLLAASGTSTSPNVIVSDDGGLTWAHGGSFGLNDGVSNIPQLGPAGLVRVTGGSTIALNDYISADEGNSWSAIDATGLGSQAAAEAQNPDTGFVIRGGSVNGLQRNTATGDPPVSPWVNVFASNLNNPCQGFWSPEWEAWVFANGLGGGMRVHRSENPTGSAGWVTTNTGLFGALSVPSCVPIPFGS